MDDDLEELRRYVKSQENYMDDLLQQFKIDPRICTAISASFLRCLEYINAKYVEKIKQNELYKTKSIKYDGVIELALCKAGK